MSIKHYLLIVFFLLIVAAVLFLFDVRQIDGNMKKTLPVNLLIEVVKEKQVFWQYFFYFIVAVNVVTAICRILRPFFGFGIINRDGIDGSLILLVIVCGIITVAEIFVWKNFVDMFFFNKVAFLESL